MRKKLCNRWLATVLASTLTISSVLTNTGGVFATELEDTAVVSEYASEEVQEESVLSPEEAVIDETEAVTEEMAETEEEAVVQEAPDEGEEEGEGEEEASQLLTGFVVTYGSSNTQYPVTIDSENKEITYYIFDNTPSYNYWKLSYADVSNIKSATISYTARNSVAASMNTYTNVAIKDGDQVTFEIPKNIDLWFNGSCYPIGSNAYYQYPYCVPSKSGVGGDVLLHLVTNDDKTEDWTIHVRRNLSVSTVQYEVEGTTKSMASGAGKTALSGEAEVSSHSDNGITLVITPVSAGVDSMTVNGEAAVKGEDGLFRIPVTLEAEENTFTIVCNQSGTEAVGTPVSLNVKRVYYDLLKSITLRPVDLFKKELVVNAEVEYGSQADASHDPELTWTIDDPTIATVTVDPADTTKCKLTHLKDGNTVLRCSNAAGVAGSCDVFSNADNPQVSFDTVATTTTGASVTLDKANKTIAYKVAENATSVTLNGIKLAEGATVTAAHFQRIYGSTGAFTDTEIKLTASNTLTKLPIYNAAISVDKDEYFKAHYILNDESKILLTTPAGTEVWTVSFERILLMSSLGITDNTGSTVALSRSFVNSVTEYSITVPTTTKSLTLSGKTPATYTSFMVGETRADQNGSVVVPMTGENVDLTVKACGNSEGFPEVYSAREYVIHVNVVKPAEVSFACETEGYYVNLVDSKKARLFSENGVYNLLPGTYTYSVTAQGYVGQTGTIIVGDAETDTVKAGEKYVQKIELVKAPESEPLTNYDSEWSMMRGGTDNNAVTDAPTPIDKNTVVVDWGHKIGVGVSTASISAQIIVNGNIICYSKNTLMELDKYTGDVIRSVTLDSAGGYQYCPAIYADGMIFFPISKGVQCVNYETFESMWIYKETADGGNRGMQYKDGYLYMSTFKGGSSPSSLVAINCTDEDPTNQKETKQAAWTLYDASGYWNTPYVGGDYVIFAATGLPYNNNDAISYLYVIDKKDGNVVQKLPMTGNCVSHTVRYNNRIYATTKAGYLYSFNMTPDGKIDETKMIDPIYIGGNCTSSPVIYNNRLYVGTAGGASGTYNDAGIYVVDINGETGAMAIAYVVPTAGNPQDSGVLSTAYVESTGYAYVYFSTNNNLGSVYMVKDKPGMTEPAPESGLFWNPPTPQFCLVSMIADEEGALYYYNDSSNLYRIVNADAGIHRLTVNSECNPLVDGGAAFDMAQTDHTVLVDADAEEITLNVVTYGGSTAWINEESGTSFTVALTGEETEVEMKLTNDAYSLSKDYKIVIRKRSTDATIHEIAVTTGTVYQVNDYLTETEDGFLAEINKEVLTAYVWPETQENAAVKVTAVSVPGMEEGDEIEAVLANEKNRYEVALADDDVNTAVIKITVTAEDGKTVNEAIVEINADGTAPVITPALDSAVRTEDTYTVNVELSEAATLYVMTVEGGDASTTFNAKMVKSFGEAMDAVKGENTIEAPVYEDGMLIFLAAEDAMGNLSRVTKISVSEFADVTAITVDETEVSLTYEEPETTVGYTIEPAEISNKPVVSVSVADETIAEAKLTEDGIVITAKATGETVVTVTAKSAISDTTVEAEIKVSADMTLPETKAVVTLRGQVAGAYVAGGIMDQVEVSSTIAENYGYNDAVPSTSVSALDALVTLHEIAFGEAFTPETKDEYLSVYSSGWIKVIFGTEESCGFAVNGGTPNDGTESEWGGYNGTMVNTTVINSNDVIDFFTYQDSAWGDYYTFVEAPETIKNGEELTVTLKGYMAMMGYLYKTPEDAKAAAVPVEGLTLGLVDIETGAVDVYTDAVADENGQINLGVMDADPGEYYLVVVSNEDEEIYAVMNPCKVVVEEAAPVEPERKFDDVAEGTWYYDYIYEAVELGLVNGKSETTFAPNALINRAEFVTIIYNMAKGEAPEYEALFKDVAEGKWYTNQILWAAKNGVVKGYEDGRFGVTDSITREQIAVMLYNYAKANDLLQDVTPADLSTFKDGNRVDSWAQEAMAWAVGAGIITGKENGVALDARGKATRAEATTMVLRFFKASNVQ